ncbi:hypothetical protein LX32DRAFT_114433 [Colletotrichum zoysiae]|uniref:BTB domain-containing protein n=1 Tax=Colletotrichum zoysiae TaxID=1216348 RepID=A0AAD9H7Z5_9PEZI|nr:hypothetical protein LX32DRAFT_114433 [Colletotrichum zoysiae]
MTTSLLEEHQRVSSDPTEMPQDKEPKPAPLQPHTTTEASAPSKPMAADDERSQISFMGSLLTAGKAFTQRTLVLYAGEGRAEFFVHQHLIPPDIIRSMSSSQSDDVAEIHLPDEEPDVVGLMVRWCYLGQFPVFDLPPRPADTKLGDNFKRFPETSTPEKSPKETKEKVEKEVEQYQTLRVYFDGSNSEGVQETVSFEEKKFLSYTQNANNNRIVKTYLRDVEGIPMTGKSNGRARAEFIQIKLVRLSRMAAKYRWARLLEATLFAYAKGEIELRRRCPIPRHIELAYLAPSGLRRLRKFMAAYASSTTQANNTRAELVPLFANHPEFLCDVMAYQDANPGGPNPLSQQVAHYCADGTQRLLTL